MDVDVVVVGGGISGLTAARVLCGTGLRVRLLEREEACGGVIRTERIGEFLIDAGPDTLLAHKPAALGLVRDLGLEASLVSPLPCRTTFVLRESGLRSLPEMSMLGLPTALRPLITAGAFSWRGKIRMAAEAFLPPRASGADESVGAFVRRRFGREAVTFVAEPVLAGLHRGDAARLSLRALFPALSEAERQYGSVARAWRRSPARPAGGGSTSLRGGLAELVAALRQQLPPGVAATGSAVAAVDRQESCYHVRLANRTIVRARAIVLATPLYVTGRLVEHLDPRLANACHAIRYLHTVNVALGYRRAAVRHPLEGWGFVVPKSERRRVRSVSWVSSKWPGRCPAGHVLIRASLEGASDGAFIDHADRTLIRWADEDLRELLEITAAPVVARVYRWRRGMPQLEVGHLDRVAAIERRLAAWSGMFMTAGGFRGVGIADCISDAQQVAAQAAASL